MHLANSLKNNKFLHLPESRSKQINFLIDLNSRSKNGDAFLTYDEIRNYLAKPHAPKREYGYI